MITDFCDSNYFLHNGGVRQGTQASKMVGNRA